MSKGKIISLGFEIIAIALASFAAFVAFAVLPSAVLAAITIATPNLIPQGNINTNQQVSITNNVNSTNDIASVLLEMKNSTSDMSNSSIANYTLGLVGPRTNGNWIIFFGGSPGIYQITRVFAKDNTSAIQTADYTNTFIGFKIIGLTPTSTTTTTGMANVTTTTTTTQTAASAVTSASTTSTSITQTSAGGSFLDMVTSTLTSNPIFIVIIAAIIIVPIIILVIVLKRRPKDVDVLPESQPPQESSTY